MLHAPRRVAAPLVVAGALLVVYVFWGSTYLAIRIAVQTLPPFYSAAARYLAAGGVMIALLWVRGAVSRSDRHRLEPMRAIHWRSAAIIGGLLLLGGNGFVVQAEQYIDSGIAAVLVAGVPIWMNLFEAIGTRRRPSPLVIGGVIAGFIGVLVLVAPFGGTGAVNAVGVGLVLFATISWALGSLYSRGAPLPGNGLLATAMEMLAGGALLALAGTLSGEFGRTHPETFSTNSLLAVGWLVVFGSIVAFSAYTWLLQNAPISTVATYAYVNPIVAVMLGALVLSEPITIRTLVASVLIIGAVVAMVSGRPRVAEEEQAGPEHHPEHREDVGRAAAD